MNGGFKGNPNIGNELGLGMTYDEGNDGNGDDGLMGLGEGYMDGEEDEKEKEITVEKKEDNKNKKNTMQKSMLKASFNNDVFGFEFGKGKENKFNKEMELNEEINQLIKDNKNLDDKLKLSMMDNEELKKIIEQKEKEIEELKKK